MTSAALEDLRRQLREADRDLLLALDARAPLPRHPAPTWTPPDPRLPPPPLAELLYAIAPAGDADPAAAVAPNRRLAAALAARQQLAADIADEKDRLHPDDFRNVFDSGDRDRLLALLTDLPAELRLLDFIRDAAADIAPHLPPGLAPLLWREHLIPWTLQSEAAHLLEP
jgi:chorismate mutase